jgi:CDP-glycerol glycerophosphotransferase
MGLSVVVACHNVAEFLPACLDSLLAQERPPTQVILVNDGSTDATGEICAQYAGQHPGWMVVDGPGSGPGGARNIGLAHVSEDHLAFVDGDDLLPPSAYRVLLGSLDKTGSDFAAGDVKRYDGVHLTPSGPHRNAILATRRRTTVRRTPSLMYDTTSWNKVFRTEFWLANGLRFHENVTYEDLPVMIAAHARAHSVDVLKAPVYYWRRRIDSDASITQRRGEMGNLVDRMNAIDEVVRVLSDDQSLKQVHDRKVLTFDVPLYLQHYTDAGVEYQKVFLDRVGAFVRQVDAEVLAELPPRDRVRYWLIGQGKHGQLVEFLEYERDPYALRRRIPGEGVTYADLPFLGEPGYPRDLYEWGLAQPVASQVESVRWTSNGLAVSGYTYLEGIDSGGPEQRKLRIRVVGGAEPFGVPVKWHHREDLTAQEFDVDATYDNVGLSFTIPFDKLPAEAVMRVDVDVAAPGGRRRVPLSGTYDGAAQLPQRVVLADGRVAVVRWRSEALAVAVYPAQALVTSVTFPRDGVLRVGFSDQMSGVTVIARRRADFEEVAAAHATTVELDLSAMPALDGEDVLDFDLFLAHDDNEPQPALVAPDVTETLQTFGAHEYYGRAGVTGGLHVSVRAPRPRLRQWSKARDGLRLVGDRADGMSTVVLENRNGLRSEYPVTASGDTWEVLLPAEDQGDHDGVRHLATGRWSLITPTGVPIHVAETTRASMAPGEWSDLNGVKVGVRARRSATAYLLIDPAGDIRPPGLHGRTQIITTYYPKRRTKRTRRIILFENWKGKQYSDNLRAIDEELRRRRDRRKRVWVVRDRGVRIPAGIPTVLRFSPEYYDMLARARWVVANDSIDPSYVKRDDQTYLQTWHGTPLKKVGQDIEKVNFARKGYLSTFADESAKWNYLVSPNEYSTQILGTAFEIPQSRILNTGYPRNDIFYRPERHARATAARARLGLREDQKVILYAPTWRDDRYDDRGRYLFDLKLNIELLQQRLGDSHVLLLRGHHLLATRAGVYVEGGFVHNVSGYPDVADLYLIADVLVTDYSSVMFDYANTGRPVILYTWDLDDYRDRVRGMYFDITADPPGPICRTSQEVLAALESLPDVRTEYASAYERFQQQFCAWEDGYAAARVIDAALR